MCYITYGRESLVVVIIEDLYSAIKSEDPEALILLYNVIWGEGSRKWTSLRYIICEWSPLYCSVSRRMEYCYLIIQQITIEFNCCPSQFGFAHSACD